MQKHRPLQRRQSPPYEALSDAPNIPQITSIIQQEVWSLKTEHEGAKLDHTKMKKQAGIIAHDVRPIVSSLADQQRSTQSVIHGRQTRGDSFGETQTKLEASMGEE